MEKCVSLWPAAREAARQTATQQSPVPTHMATIHHCPPPTSTSLLPSILSFLICSSHPRRLLSARSHSSRPATSTGALLIVVSPASLCCLCVRLCLSYLRTCVDAINNTQPLVAALPAVVGDAATRTAELLPGLYSQSLFMSVSHIYMTVTHSPAARAERKDAMRNNCFTHRVVLPMFDLTPDHHVSVDQLHSPAVSCLLYRYTT